jgi:cell division protease FtsH
VVLTLVEESEPLHKVTIIPRGAALGATMQLPEKDRYTQGQKKLESMLAGLMGGRVAEELVFGDVTTGAQNDLRQASRIARMMVCEWGMSPAMGPQSFGEREELLFLGREVSRSQEFSEETARRIDAEVSRIINAAHDKAVRILKEHRPQLDTIAALLIERETLEGRDIKEIIQHGRILDEIERAEADAGAAGSAQPGGQSGSEPGKG